jgi:hypothetical protein
MPIKLKTISSLISVFSIISITFSIPLFSTKVLINKSRDTDLLTGGLAIA